MEPIHKVFEATQEDGWLVVNTPTLDRENDRVFPTAAQTANYLKNPVLLFGHNYHEPWAVIGKAAELRTSTDDLRIRPELRAPANDGDPMHVIRALWDQGLLRAASIGFWPRKWTDNAEGGRDYTEWELLEISLVPVPANQEALRLAVKGLGVSVERLDPDATSVAAGADLLGEDAPTMITRVVDETENTIRVRIFNPEKCQEGSFRTITLEPDKGITATICKPQGEDKTRIQAVIFDKSKGWTVESAQAWVRDHDLASRAALSARAPSARAASGPEQNTVDGAATEGGECEGCHADTPGGDARASNADDNALGAALDSLEAAIGLLMEELTDGRP